MTDDPHTGRDPMGERLTGSTGEESIAELKVRMWLALEKRRQQVIEHICDDCAERLQSNGQIALSIAVGPEACASCGRERVGKPMDHSGLLRLES